MSEILNQIYEMGQPILIMAAATFVTGLLGWIAIEVPKTAWYKRQPWVVRKVVDVALRISVAKLQPEAERIKRVYGGKLPSYEADMLKQAAVQDAMEVIKLEHPEIDKAVSTRKLEATISERVAPAVAKVKKERRNRMRNRGH